MNMILCTVSLKVPLKQSSLSKSAHEVRIQISLRGIKFVLANTSHRCHQFVTWTRVREECNSICLIVSTYIFHLKFKITCLKAQISWLNNYVIILFLLHQVQKNMIVFNNTFAKTSITSEATSV